MQSTLFETLPDDALTLKEACVWASKYLHRNVTVSNITYLINYGKIKKVGDNGSSLVSKGELKNYYDSYYGKREISWKSKLGDDLDWHLSFDYLREVDTTKHVHRLHPYKGKFIPQLVEYFLDNHTDEFKKEVYFHPGDIILDPFCGSGTTLVQSNELGMHSIGIDVSSFNSLISNVKIGKYNIIKLKQELDKISGKLRKFVHDSNVMEFENKLAEELVKFNNEYFPSPDFKHWVKDDQINEFEYGREKEQEFLRIYNKLIKKYSVELNHHDSNSFIGKWYLESVRKEIHFVFDRIKGIEDVNIKKIVSLILSRTIRSCRATTHSDLATLVEPVTKTYYCHKHGKICKPLFSILGWWERYSKDTIKRVQDFARKRTDTNQICLTGDSREINLIKELEKKDSQLAELTKRKKIKGIFSSPPYVGLIDYHEQHAYAYDLFGFERNDELEIGPLYKGKGKEARESYVEGISKVLINMKKYLVKDFDIFLVANDKNNLYPTIAEKSGLKIIQQFKRPVLNRTERDKAAYSEIIFNLKNK
jgi:DNA methylase